MLIHEQKCVYRAYSELLDWLNKRQPIYLKDLGCDECINPESRKCKITLREIIEHYEFFKRIDET